MKFHELIFAALILFLFGIGVWAIEHYRPALKAIAEILPL